MNIRINISKAFKSSRHSSLLHTMHDNEKEESSLLLCHIMESQWKP